jgi:hypothetical protein
LNIPNEHNHWGIFPQMCEQGEIKEKSKKNFRDVQTNFCQNIRMSLKSRPDLDQKLILMPQQKTITLIYYT